MKKSVCRFLQIVLFLTILTLVGCATNQQGYQKAFNSQNSLTQNQCSLSQPPDRVFKVAKQILIRRGFTIENADTKTGIIKGARNMADKEDNEISYNINASLDISEESTDETTVSMAASQQTILHRATTTWWHLLWILPIIPTGTEYQTLVIKEGNITDPAVYADFCNALKEEVTKQKVVAKEAAAKASEKAETERVAAEKANAKKPTVEKPINNKGDKS